MKSPIAIQSTTINMRKRYGDKSKKLEENYFVKIHYKENLTKKKSRYYNQHTKHQRRL